MWNKLLFFWGVIAYRILLDYTYINIVSVRFSYAGYTYADNVENYYISWFLLIPFLFTVMPFASRKEFVISNAAVFLFLLRIVPLTSLIASKPFTNNFILAEIVFWGLFFLVLRINIFKQSALHFSHNQRLLKFILILSCFVVVFISGVYANFRLHFDLSIAVYELRSEAKTFDIPIILRYLLAMAKNVLPLLFVYYWQEKKKWICFLIVFVTVLNFSINGLKSTIFLLLLGIVLQAIYKKKITFWVPICFALLCIAPIIEIKLFNTFWVNDLIIRRVLYTPALLDSYYFDYISKNGPIYYQQGFHYIIGDEYFGQPDMQANNGMFADAYLNLGYIGIIIYPLIYAFFFKFCASISRGVNEKILMFAVIIIVFTLHSTAFTTTLLTHGLLAICLLLYIMPKRQ